MRAKRPPDEPSWRDPCPCARNRTCHLRHRHILLPQHSWSTVIAHPLRLLHYNAGDRIAGRCTRHPPKAFHLEGPPMQFQSRRVVVTGGTGALGAAVAQSLITHGAEVWIPVHGKKGNPLPGPGRVEYVEGVDLTDESAVAAFYQKAG